MLQPDQLDTRDSARHVETCGVVLDFIPMGYFDARQSAAGFDVGYCNDLAAALGVESNILILPGVIEFILISGKPMWFRSTSATTLERAKSFGFNLPVLVSSSKVIARKTRICQSFDDLENLKVGAGHWALLTKLNTCLC